MASGGPSMYHPWPSMEFAMTTYKLDPLVARPGPSMAMDVMPWSLSTGSKQTKFSFSLAECSFTTWSYHKIQFALFCDTLGSNTPDELN